MEGKFEETEYWAYPCLVKLTNSLCVYSNRPLVAGTSESDQLDRIFRLLGTPTTVDYPGIVELPEYSPDQFPPYPPPRGGLASLVPALDATGVDLLSKMIQYDPSRRVTAQAALEHPFFAEMKGGAR
jgi:cyclin-dependent kinase